MTKLNKFLVAVVALPLLLGVILISMPKVQAFEVRENKNLEKDEVVTGDLFISGESVKIAGTINGNLFVGGSMVDISGKVTGNVFAAGSVVYVTGEVGRTLFVGASTLDVSGSVGRDIFVGAGQVSLNGKVTENVFVGAGTLFVKDEIVENLYAGAGQVTVLGTVGKDAFVSAGSATLDKSQVKGILTLELEKKADREIDAAIRKEQMRQDAKKVMAGVTTFAIFMKVLFFIGMFLFGLFFLKYFPVFSASVEKEMQTAFWKNTGIGLLLSFAAPVAVIVLLLTIVGIPFALAIVAVLMAVAFVTQIWVGNVVGRVVFKQFKKEYSTAVNLLVGMLIVTFVGMIPVIGFFARMIVSAVALGSVVSVKLDRISGKK